jgi:hypothetical protein
MIKVVAPNMACDIIDWAMQVHGGGGMCDDFALAYSYASARTLRFADGPDEVHRNAIAKAELGRRARLNRDSQPGWWGLVQMAWLAATATVARSKPPAARRLAQVERADERIKALGKYSSTSATTSPSSEPSKVALHQLHHIIDQQIALDLHDGLRVGAYKQHHKIVA